MRRLACLLAMVLLSPVSGAAELRLLLVDGEHLESGLAIYADLERKARTVAVGVDRRQRSEVLVQAELRRSEILNALPEIVAAIAEREGADLVLDRQAATRIGVTIEVDITEEVERIVQERFADFELELP